MPQAASPSSTDRDRNNVVAFPVPTDTFITPLMLFEVRREVTAVLPVGWFNLSMVAEEDGGQRQDHIHLERVVGPPIGCFQLWRERGRFVVEALPEPNDICGDVERVGRHRSMVGAVRGILDHINGRLMAWTLPPLAPRAA